MHLRDGWDQTIVPSAALDFLNFMYTLTQLCDDDAEEE